MLSSSAWHKKKPDKKEERKKEERVKWYDDIREGGGQLKTARLFQT